MNNCDGCISYGRNCVIIHAKKYDQCPCQFCIVKTCCRTTLDTCLPFKDLLAESYDATAGVKYG